MCREKVGKIELFLVNQVGETKGLSQWCYEVNKVLSPNRGVSNKELAYIFNRFFKKKFTIKYSQDPIEYAFFPLS